LENKAHFSFKPSCLREDGFYEMVAKEWASISVETALWRYGRIRSVISKLFTMVGRNQSSTYKKEKEGSSNIIEFLDQKSQTMPADRNRKRCFQNYKFAIIIS
jgi:hypothetical protein